MPMRAMYRTPATAAIEPDRVNAMMRTTGGLRPKCLAMFGAVRTPMNEIPHCDRRTLRSTIITMIVTTAKPTNRLRPESRNEGTSMLTRADGAWNQSLYMNHWVTTPVKASVTIAVWTKRQPVADEPDKGAADRAGEDRDQYRDCHRQLVVGVRLVHGERTDRHEATLRQAHLPGPSDERHEREHRDGVDKHERASQPPEVGAVDRDDHPEPAGEEDEPRNHPPRVRAADLWPGPTDLGQLGWPVLPQQHERHDAEEHDERAHPDRAARDLRDAQDDADRETPDRGQPTTTGAHPPGWRSGRSGSTAGTPAP